MAAEMGTVASLWRYPVKSMRGEELPATEVTEHVLLGDRAYALIDDADGKVATAKNPGKWPTLFGFHATLPQGDLPRDSGILRTAVQHSQDHVGCYAVVVQGGTIQRGDHVKISESL